MYRVVMGEVGSTPHVAELFYDAGPKNAYDMLTSFLVNYPKLQVEPSKAFKISVAFFNLLKGEYHMKELFGLPCNTNESDVDQLVNEAVNHVLLLAETK